MSDLKTRFAGSYLGLVWAFVQPVVSVLIYWLVFGHGLKSGQSLEELPSPYNLGFNTNGLWSISRHPNYFAEQSIWISFYIFSIGAGIGLFNWSIIGCLLLVVLFLGSSALAEEISGGKYPLYQEYCQSVSRFLPGKKYVR